MTTELKVPLVCAFCKVVTENTPGHALVEAKPDNGMRVAICDSCVATCVEVLRGHRAKTAKHARIAKVFTQKKRPRCNGTAPTQSPEGGTNE